ncbi:hypothetical protein B0H10DRAFT_1955505 [Mycena sp. CBHHK59/15]|nr:hypothetical protein B0H10DRAFT_1955505 [Mycena sp. CBHHK59/15]
MPSPNPSPAGEPGVVLAQPDPGKNDMVFKPRQQTIDFISPPWASQEHSGQQQAPTGAFTLCLCCADSSHNCRRGQNVCYVPERVHHHSRDSWSRAPLFVGSRTSGSNPTSLFHDHSDVNMEMPGLYIFPMFSRQTLTPLEQTSFDPCATYRREKGMYGPSASHQHLHRINAFVPSLVSLRWMWTLHAPRPWNILVVYYEHTVFGKMGRQSTAENDLTISDAVAAMADLGLDDDSDGELDAEYSHDESGWSPHSSKAMFMLDLLDNLPSTWTGLANPLVQEFIQVYPEITEHVSEFNQAGKWTKEIDLDDLSPMWADWERKSDKHFYVKELAQLESGQFVVPIACVMDLQYNFLDLEQSGYVMCLPDSAPDWAQKMPNPVRKIAKGCPVFSLWIVPWSDNVSGNVSKQFNLHMNLYMLNANLPHQKSSQEYFVQFCSASPHASSREQFKALADDLGPDKYHEAYDCELEQDILFRIFAHVLPADNPQQAESTSNAGVHSNYRCHYDKVGGTAAERETDDGYCALFKPGISRTPAKTVQTIKQQIWAACSGVQEAVDNLQTSTGVKDKTALFWIEKLIVKARETQRQRLAADPCLKDKNLKGDARKAVKTKIKDLIQWELYNWVILQPDDHYARIPKKSSARSNLCAGDHYNILLSVRGASFEFSTLSESHLAQVLIRIRIALVRSYIQFFWVMTNISGTRQIRFGTSQRARHLTDWLQADLQICINNVLDIWGLIDPAWIVMKYKLHVLPHLPDDIRRFGPSILFQTEVFECWNGIFRLCSILSNHQAPSHDIGVTLADMERFKHQVSRGWWKPTGSQEYVQAGTKVISFLHHNKELQWWLGWMDESRPKPRSIKLESRSKARSGTWRDLLEPYWTQELDIHASGKTWTTCKYVVSKSGDVCSKRSWVFFTCKETEAVLAGRICDILIPSSSVTQHAETSVVIQCFNISATLDECMCMPVLSLSPDILVAKPADILFIFNVQHDCYGSKRPAVEDAESVIQEQSAMRKRQKVILHRDTNIYFINMHALHNADLLRDTLPRNLTAPIPYFPDHDAKHKEFAALLRVSGPAKHATALKKSKETWERNLKVRKGVTAVGVEGDMNEEADSNPDASGEH